MKEKAHKSPKSTVLAFTVKIWTVHIISLICYIFLLAAIVPIFGDSAGIAVASVISPIIYFSLTYIEAWRTGSRDRNLVKYGRINHDRLKAVKAAALSQLPPAGLSIAVVIMGEASSSIESLIRFFYMPFAYELDILAAISRLFYFLPAILPFISVIPGYFLGLKERRIIDKVVFTRPGKGSDDLRR